MFQVMIEQDVVYNGPIQKVGGGGTKTAYQLVDTDFVVLLPNETDGQWLIDMFDRICTEEVYMYNYLTAHGLLGLPVTPCMVKHQGQVVNGLYAPAFTSFVQKKAHIIDKKNWFTCTWKPQETEKEIQDWLPVFQPFLQDLTTLLKSNVTPKGDSFNFLIAEHGSPYHVGSALYALRYFGFDFTSKRAPLQRTSYTLHHELVQTVVNEAIEEAVDVVLLYCANVSTKQVDELKTVLLNSFPLYK